MTAVIISDGKPGHVNQARALCGIMGWDSREYAVNYSNGLMKAAGYFLDNLGIYTQMPFRLLDVKTDRLVSVSNLEGDIFICVGSASYYPAKFAARKAAKSVIALMYPRGFRLNFDHIICPAYDNPSKKANITTLPVTLSCRDDEYYNKAAGEFENLHDVSLPAAAVIIGGDNKYGSVTREKVKKNLKQIFDLTKGYQRWVTTSRRTSDEVEDVVESFPFDYKLIYSKQQYNPIPAFIALSDYLFVTSDSSSMISECVSGGKAKVEVLKNQVKKPGKFDIFLTGLEKDNYVHIFDGNLGNADRKISLSNKITNALAEAGLINGKNRR